MAPPRLATYTVNGAQKYGAVTDSGIVDLSARFGKEFPTLREAIADRALMKRRRREALPDYVTGTPTGVGARFDPPRYLKPGDVIEVEAEGVGVLKNGVADEA